MLTNTSGFKVWENGVLFAGDGTAAYPDFYLQRILWGYLSTSFVGAAKDIISMVTDGSAAMDATVTAIRAYLANKHGLAVT
ncbi:hypothetical protein PE067_08475 [Paracoccus sp. DMF-8]|uniref:hypothetical protein n=1 Tax=Paracoccus sp. DMF-8 TaxID=3019445 RepID=UPI0023E8BF14|nr:hypothetical protein [Paracoccus sp. DMF-8]MDF3606160.1 hypothetical protein [Paracoccus sp. DMF-8]